jgi:hypothetical protein
MFVFNNTTQKDISAYVYELYEEDQIVNPNAGIYELIENAEPVSSGQNNASVFAINVNGSYVDEDGVEQKKHYYGRVRLLNTSGVYGSWTPVTRTDIETELIDEQYIVSLTADRIKAGEIESAAIILGGANPINTIIKSKTYDTSSGVQGWYIRGDGHFVLGGSSGISYNGSTVTIGSGVNVNAQVNANSISVGNGTYGYLTIDENIGPTNTDFGIELGDPDYNYWYANGKFKVGNSTVNVEFNGSSLSVKNANLQLGSVAGNDYAEITSSGDFLVVGYDGTTSSYGSSRFYGPWFNVKKGSNWSANAANAQLMWDNLVFYKSTPGAYGIFIAGGNDTGNAFIDVGATGITDNGSVSCNGWFRSSGSTGWYNQTHGGGIWMQDSTWVRVYGNKSFYVNKTLRADEGIQAGDTGVSWAGSVSATNWFRSKGSSGWYHEDYGGGIFMDESTTVKVYNNKNFYTAGTITAGLFSSAGTIYLANVGPSSSDEVMVRISTGEVKKRTLSNWSLREMKEEISPLSQALDKIVTLKPCTFRFKEESLIENEPFDSFDRREQLQYGFIMDEVQSSKVPDLVKYSSNDGITSFAKTWKQDGVISLAVAAIQELLLRVEDLESRLV